MTSAVKSVASPWRRCKFCREIAFKSPQDFRIHIRNNHCKKEGGSYVCSYGRNNVCSSLPLEGVSEKDYDFHVAKHHVLAIAEDERNQEEEEFMENLCEKYRNIVSTSQMNQQPNVVQDQYKWTIYDCTQNLPAVSNDPRRLKRESDLFTQTWGDGFVENVTLPYCPYLPQIDFVHFESYLKHAKKRMQHQSRKALSRRRSDSASSLVPSLSSKVASSEIYNELDDVPKVFMQTDFHLENPEIFNAILPWAQLYGHLSSERGITPKNSVKLLQEKLSHFLDSVEVQIAKQISVKSEAFFHAMTSHDTLMEQLSHVIQSVCALRERIHSIEDVMVKAPVAVMQLKNRQSNYIKVYNKLKLMATVHQTQPTIQQLLSTSEFVGALELIYTTQDVLVQELPGIQSFRHLSSQLAEMEKVIGKMMQTDFIRYVTTDLNRPPSEKNVMEEDQLSAILCGMLRLNDFSFVPIFKDECYHAIDAAVKQAVIEIISEADDFEVENSTGDLTEQLRPLNFVKWLELLQLALKSLNFLLRRIQALYNVMNETTDAAICHHRQLLQTADGESGHIFSEQDYLNVKSNLKELICAVCDHAHDCCAKFLTAKAKDGSLDRLHTSEFVLLSKGIEEFQDHCESICGRQSMPLRLALQNQATRFAARFHEERKTKLNFCLETEQWKQADVPVEFQQMVDHIVSTGSFAFWVASSGEREQKPEPYIFVEDENYTVVGAVLILLKLVIEYCQCAEDVPMLASDLAVRLVDLLKCFNTKTCQLVLGAGALQVLGLKTITSKHLALASRCLKFITYFLPQIKDHFRRKIPAKQQVVVKHFDQLFKIFNKHIDEITDKLEKIISNMFDAQLKQWEVKAPVPSPCFRSISKLLKKFHELLSDHLPSTEVQSIFQRVNEVFKVKLKQHLVRLQVNMDGGPQHGLVTQELMFYTQNLKNLNLQCDFSANDLRQTR